MLTEYINENIYTTDISMLIPDPVVLTHDKMLSGHGVLYSKSGTAVHLSLEEGHILHDGDILTRTGDTVIYVLSADEDALVITPLSPIEWGRVCYNIGNMHMKAYLSETEVIVPYDYVLESVIKKLNIPYTREIRKIKGINANAGVFHHHHHR